MVEWLVSVLLLPRHCLWCSVCRREGKIIHCWSCDYNRRIAWVLSDVRRDKQFGFEDCLANWDRVTWQCKGLVVSLQKCFFFFAPFRRPECDLSFLSFPCEATSLYLAAHILLTMTFPWLNTKRVGSTNGRTCVMIKRSAKHGAKRSLFGILILINIFK